LTSLAEWVSSLPKGRRVTAYTSHNFAFTGVVVSHGANGELVLADEDCGLSVVMGDQISALRYSPNEIPKEILDQAKVEINRSANDRRAQIAW